MAVTAEDELGAGRGGRPDHQLVDAVARVVEPLRADGLERWNTVLQFEPRSGRPFHLVVAAGRVRVCPGGHPAPTTVVEATADAVTEVFFTGRDVTHQFAHGGMRLRGGDYYDVVFLSRALGRLHRGLDRQDRGGSQ